MTISRRRFLGMAGGAVAVSAGGTALWEGLLRDQLDGHSSEQAGTGKSLLGTDGKKLPAAAQRVLVVVQLTGGNDGLNTLVPLDGRYHDARPTLGVADKDLVHLTGESRYALAPELKPLADLWQSGRLAALEGVGFEGASHSHFQALDWWWSATPGASSTTGWLGRWLDATAGSGAPNPLRGIALGSGAPVLRPQHAMATVINDPSLFALRAPKGVDNAGLLAAFSAAGAPLSPGGQPPVDALARASMVDVVSAVDRLAPTGIGTLTATGAKAGGSQQPGSGKARMKRGPQAAAQAAVGGGAGSVTDGLDLAAKLIDLDLGTQVIVVGAGGYDTHAGETETHKALLDDLAGGLTSFFATIDKTGHGDRALVLTTSEFGRRVQENGSGGTDHGSGSVHFVAGSGVNRKVEGTADLGRLTAEGDVPPAIDARSLYSIGLDWLGAPTREVLGTKRYDTYGVLRT